MRCLVGSERIMRIQGQLHHASEMVFGKRQAFGIKTWELLAQKTADIKKPAQWRFPDVPTWFIN